MVRSIRTTQSHGLSRRCKSDVALVRSLQCQVLVTAERARAGLWPAVLTGHHASANSLQTFRQIELETGSAESSEGRVPEIDAVA
jgi:hypothetical protein